MQYISIQQLSLSAGENKKAGEEFVLLQAPDIRCLPDCQFIGCKIMIFVYSGTLDVSINGNLRRVGKNSLVDVLDGTMVRFGELSQDAEVYCAFTTKSFILDALQGVMPDHRNYLFKMLVDPVISLAGDVCENVRMQMRMLADVLARPSHLYRMDKVKLYVKAFSLEMSNALKAVDDDSLTFHKISKKEFIMVSFIDLVWKHLTDTREVSFYARELCVTPKHLSRIVRETSGKTPHEIIAGETLSMSLQLLQNNSLLIQQIADILHFSDQASFSKFFKKYVGMSPAEYRRQYFEMDEQH